MLRRDVVMEEKMSHLACAAELIPILWKIIEKDKKCSANISTQNDKTTVSIKKGGSWKRFTFK